MLSSLDKVLPAVLVCTTQCRFQSKVGKDQRGPQGWTGWLWWGNLDWRVWGGSQEAIFSASARNLFLSSPAFGNFGSVSLISVFGTHVPLKEDILILVLFKP